MPGERAAWSVCAAHLMASIVVRCIGSTTSIDSRSSRASADRYGGMEKRPPEIHTHTHRHTRRATQKTKGACRGRQVSEADASPVRAPFAGLSQSRVRGWPTFDLFEQRRNVLVVERQFAAQKRVQNHAARPNIHFSSSVESGMATRK